MISTFILSDSGYTENIKNKLSQIGSWSYESMVASEVTIHEPLINYTSRWMQAIKAIEDVVKDYTKIESTGLGGGIES